MAGLIPGIAVMVVLAAGLGLAFNFMNSNGLPLVRKPLRETRPFVSASVLLAQVPSQPKQADKPPVAEPAAMQTAPTTKAPAKPPMDVSQVPTKKPAKTTPRPVTTPTQTPSMATPKPMPKTVSEAESKTDPPKKAEALFTNLKDAKSLFDKKAAIFLDGRPIEDYEAEHIPGSLSLFCEKVDDLYEKVLAGVPKNRIIVTYCSDPECTEAIDLADALVAKGYTKVVILLEGLPGWKDAGYPTTKGKEPG